MSDMHSPTSQVAALISRGKEQGYLTYAEVNDHLPDSITESEQIEDIIQMLQDVGIPVHERAPESDDTMFGESADATDEVAEEEAAAVLASVENGIEFPFEIEEADVESSLGDWSVGFVDAMFLNEDAWFAPEYEEQLIDLTLPMMVFSGIDEEDPQMESFRRNGQLMDELAEEIPDNLNELYLMYHTPN